VPQLCPPQHGVIAAADLERGHVRDQPGLFRVQPGVGGAGDAVGRPVGEQDAPPGQLRHGLTGRQPGRQARHRGHRGMPGHPHRRAGAHRMADQHHGDVPELSPDLIQHRPQVGHGRGLLAIPSPELVARAAHHHPGAAQSLPDRAGHRDHPQDRELCGGGWPGADGLAAVGHHDHPGDAGPGCPAGAIGYLTAHPVSPLWNGRSPRAGTVRC
jgi:hypothetical protein